MDTLVMLMQAHRIPYELKSLWGGTQLVYPGNGKYVCDAVCHDFSYGHERGLLELMGLVDEEKVGDTVEGYLTGEEVFNRIKKHWEENK